MSSQHVDITTAPSPTSGGCGCCSTGQADPQPADRGTEDQVTTGLRVTGMTCGHCVSAVTAELSALEGVTGVDVDLVAGGTSTVTVTSATPLPDQAVAAAIDEAGYDLLSRS